MTDYVAGQGIICYEADWGMTCYAADWGIICFMQLRNDLLCSWLRNDLLCSWLRWLAILVHNEMFPHMSSQSMCQHHLYSMPPQLEWILI